MTHRYVSLWFRYLVTDWFTRRDPALAKLPFVLTASEPGRVAITAANRCAEEAGIFAGMALPMRAHWCRH
jgi:protein ImuB